MSVSLAPVIRQRYLDANGKPLSGGKLYSYQAGTTTPQATYTDSTGSTPNTNPVVLNANGEANVWLDISLSYKFVLNDSLDNIQWTTDGVVGLTSNNSVSTQALQDHSVTTVKMALGSVDSTILASDALIDANRPVTTNAIKDAQITVSKMDGATASSSKDIYNLGLTATVSANALTISAKTKALVDATSATPITVSFRDSVATTADYVVRKITSALSLVVSSSLGMYNSATEYIYVYLLDSAATIEIAVSVGTFFDDGTIVNTTAISGGTARGTIYSATARTGVAIRVIGRIKISEVTAGTFASAPTEVSVVPFNVKPNLSYIEMTGSTANGSTNTNIPRWTTVTNNFGGSAMTLTQSATLGDRVTVNEEGIYSIVASFGASGGNDWEIGLNSTSLSNIDANVLASFESPDGTGRNRTITFVGHLAASSIINVVTASGATYVSNGGRPAQFKITQLLKL